MKLTHGQSRTRLYFVWQAMKRRCHRVSAKDFPRYGGRGVVVCDEWRNSFEAFAAHVGPQPDGFTLDRKDTRGNYEPGNVRWATYTEQARNTRRNRMHTIDGQTRCLAEWCEILKRALDHREETYRGRARPFYPPSQRQENVTVNDTARKHPRSLVEAFGPYTDHTLEQMPSPRPAPWHKHDVIVGLACAIAVVGLLVVLAVWG